jgi:hypothetical protein
VSEQALRGGVHAESSKEHGEAIKPEIRHRRIMRLFYFYIGFHDIELHFGWTALKGRLETLWMLWDFVFLPCREVWFKLW